MNIKEIFKKILDIVNDFKAMSGNNKLDVYAACASFYIFMSFIPFMTIMLAIIPFLSISQADLIRIIMTVIPKEYIGMVDWLVDSLYLNNASTIVISAVATIWASGRGIMGITKGLNAILDVNDNRNFIILRIRSAFYTLFLFVGMILLIPLSVFGNRIRSFIGKYVIIPDFIDNLWEIKNIAVLIVLILLFCFFFVALPAKKMKIRQQIPGALISATVWWLFTGLFSFYLEKFNSYSIYGGFAVIVIMTVWLYTGMLIMFMGAQFNQFIASRKGIIYEGSNKRT